MSACNVLIQRRAVHIMVDGAAYTSDGILRSISQKCFAVPTAGSVVSALGAGFAAFVFSYEIGESFNSFDAVVRGIEDAMPTYVEKHQTLLASSEFPDFEIFIAGWSNERGGPEAYLMHVYDPASFEHWNKVHAESGTRPESFKLQKLEGLVGNPGPTAEEFRAAKLRFACTAEELPEQMTAGDLLHILEIQRRRRVPLRSGLDAHHWVGGLALLTTVTRDGISQRVMHRWGEDEVGKAIHPRPIDWESWRASRGGDRSSIVPKENNTPTAPPPSMSRHARRKFEAEQRKLVRVR